MQNLLRKCQHVEDLRHPRPTDPVPSRDLILGGTAAWLAYETKSLLIGESANPEVVDCIRDIAGSYPQIEHVNEVLTMHMGPDYILVNLSVDFVDTTAAEEIETVIAELDRKLKKRIPEVKRVFVEAEPRKLPE